MIRNSMKNIYILIGLLVFAISMLIDTNADTVALGVLPINICIWYSNNNNI